MRRPFAGTGAEVLVDAVGVNGGALVRFYDAESGGSQVTDLQTTDGTPIAGGVVTAGQYGKIPRFLGPDDGRAKLWADGGLDRLMLIATDTTDRTSNLETSTPRLVDGTLVDPVSGDLIPTGGVTEEEVTAVIEGGSGLALPAGTTIGGAAPGTFLMDKAAGTVAFSTGVDGEFLEFSGGTLTTGGPTMGSGYTDNIQYDWAGPFTDPATLAATKGGIALIGTGSASGSATQNAIVADGGQSGLFFRGHTGSLDATLTTPVVMESEDNYTTISWLIRRLTFGFQGLSATYCYIASLNDVNLVAILNADATAFVLEVYRGSATWASSPTPEMADYTLPGDTTAWKSGLSAGWKVLTLALKQGQQGKLLLGSTVLATGIDTDGVAALSAFTMDANGFVPSIRGGFIAKRITIATGMTDAKIAALHADMLASVA